MDLLEWARNEVKLACEKEYRLANGDIDTYDYGYYCYLSALKAFESLINDNHSGCSMSITMSILNALADGNVLTPITENDEWIDVTDDHDIELNRHSYQCKRMSSFFKYIPKDGTVEYYDIYRIMCVNINDHNDRYQSSYINSIISDMFPITLPYFRGPAIDVYVEEFLTDPANGDFDTIGIMYIIKDGEKIEINKFLKETDKGFEEISLEEYNERKKVKITKD